MSPALCAAPETRITLTNSAFECRREAAFLVEGAEKKTALTLLRADDVSVPAGRQGALRSIAVFPAPSPPVHRVRARGQLKRSKKRANFLSGGEDSSELEHPMARGSGSDRQLPATPRPTIFSGLTIWSNRRASMYPDLRAASLRLIPSSFAMCAMADALS